MNRPLASACRALPIGIALCAIPSIGVPQDAIARPERWPAPAWPIATDEGVERRVAALVEAMSIAEKVGQILQGDIATVTPRDVREYHLGAVLAGGNSGPGGDDKAPPAAWLALADELHAASVDTADGGVPVPILWGIDAVHGHANIVGATVFPHNIGLGAMDDADVIERIGAATALEVRTTGQTWTFAPTVTVPRDYRWGRAYEGYSSDPALVARYAARMIRGLQGDPSRDIDGGLLAGPHVLASAKHFLADGGTANGIDQGDAAIDERELRDVHGAPYVPAIENGVATVMASFSSWNGVKVTGNRSLLTGVLKERMNFGGFTVSDWNAHAQIPGCSDASCPEALLAGIDMYMAPDTWKALHASLSAQVASGRIPMARLDEAVANVLRVKLRLGLFEAGEPSARPHAGDWSLLGAPAHRALAREAVRKSLVLLKHGSGLLPLAPGTRLLVAGDGADDVGRQSGGWSVTWQGTGVTDEDFPGATSLWRGLADAVTAAGGEVALDPEGDYDERPDAAVVVFGETPYAEFQGDLTSLRLSPTLRRPYETMRRLAADGIPVIAVMITGRPLFVNPELNVADDFVVAWLPGSEGGGVADLLVAGEDGEARFDFTGTLPAAWPGDAEGNETLYPRGHGLTLDGPAGGVWETLDENVGTTASSDTVWFERGAPGASWSLEVSDGTGSTTRVTTVPLVAANGAVTIEATDHDVQEGARRFTVGDDEIDIALVARSPIDIEAIDAREESLLTFALRLDARPAAPLRLAVGDGGDAIDIPADTFPEDGDGAWRTVAVPIRCFRERGVELRQVSVPFRLSVEGPATLSLSRVALDEEHDVLIGCGG